MQVLDKARIMLDDQIRVQGRGILWIVKVREDCFCGVSIALLAHSAHWQKNAKSLAPSGDFAVRIRRTV